VRKINVGIVGIGFGQQVHVPAFRSHPQCEVIAICASHLERAEKVAKRLHIPKAFGNWQAMLDDPQIEVISIATPPTVQAPIVMAALSKRKPVFCEKPLAASPQIAQEMLTIANQNQVAHMVDFWFAENEAWIQAKSMLEMGKIGQLRHMVVLWQVETYANKQGLTSWKTQTMQGGGTLYSFLSHTFHYLEWLGGKIQAMFARLSHAPQDNRKGDSLDILCLEFESGVNVSVCISSHAFLGNGHRVELYGDEGTLVLDNSSSDYNNFRLLYGSRLSNQLKPIPLNNPNCGYADGRILPVSQLVNKFISWIDTGVPQSPSFVEGVRVQQLLAIAQKSHQLGQWLTQPF
jgi:predicted dehydrogenase